mmetsp:Transcript_12755/g.24934  ORF Transcript_12755/g.24934 Transcript_12755/m.24934 type:complete len:215 (+) Transcript_12755:277-921(+)
METHRVQFNLRIRPGNPRPQSNPYHWRRHQRRNQKKRRRRCPSISNQSRTHPLLRRNKTKLRHLLLHHPLRLSHRKYLFLRRVWRKSSKIRKIEQSSSNKMFYVRLLSVERQLQAPVPIEDLTLAKRSLPAKHLMKKATPEATPRRNVSRLKKRIIKKAEAEQRATTKERKGRPPMLNSQAHKMRGKQLPEWTQTMSPRKRYYSVILQIMPLMM